MMHDFMITHDGKMNARVYYLDGKHVTEKTYKRAERECGNFDTLLQNAHKPGLWA